MNKYDEIIKKYEKAEKILSKKYDDENEKYEMYKDTISVIDKRKSIINDYKQLLLNRKHKVKRYLLLNIVCFLLGIMLASFIFKYELFKALLLTLVCLSLPNVLMIEDLILLLRYPKYKKDIQDGIELYEESIKKLEKKLPDLEKNFNINFLNSLQSELTRVSNEKLKLQDAYSDAKEKLISSEIFEESLNTSFEETEGISRKRRK